MAASPKSSELIVPRRRTRAGSGAVVSTVTLTLTLWVAAGCSAHARPEPVAVDCNAEAPYEFSPVEENDDSPVSWYSYGDLTPGATHTPANNGSIAPTAIPGGRCGDGFSLLLESHGHNDYGSGFGSYNFANMAISYASGAAIGTPINVSAYEGVSFWARSWDPNGNPTTKGVTLTIGDAQTFFFPGGPGGTPDVDGGCFNATDGGALGGGVIVYGGPGVAGGAAGGGAALAHPPPGSCGNAYTYPLLTTDQWQLYTIPFTSFYQGLQPNRVPEGFDPSTFGQFLVIAPAEAALELWLDNVGFYRHKQSDGGP